MASRCKWDSRLVNVVKPVEAVLAGEACCDMLRPVVPWMMAALFVWSSSDVLVDVCMEYLCCMDSVGAAMMSIVSAPGEWLNVKAKYSVREAGELESISAIQSAAAL